jgi:HAMP domain-containing protein
VTVPRWLPAAAITVFAAGITWLNRGERVALDIGITTFYRAPLTVVLFLAFLAGMLSMLWLSLRQDLRTREELRARGLLDAPARPAAPQATESGHPEQTPARAEPVPAWREEETAVRQDPSPEWRRQEETAERPEPAPADDRTVSYPRYDEDPAA